MADQPHYPMSPIFTKEEDDGAQVEDTYLAENISKRDDNIAIEGESDDLTTQVTNSQIHEVSQNAGHDPLKTVNENNGHPSREKRNYDIVSGYVPLDIFPKTSKPTTEQNSRAGTTVYFYLFIPENCQVHHPKILFDQPVQSMPLCRVHDEKDLWSYGVTFDLDPTKLKAKYKYKIVSENLVSGRSERSSLSNCKENDDREIKKHVQFDSFRFPDNVNRSNEAASMARIQYVKFLMKFVKDSTIYEIFSYVEDFNFNSFEKHHVKELVNWILDKAVENAITIIQRLYLCMVLNLVHKYFKLSGLKDKKSACDRFLECFATVSSGSHFSKDALSCLKKLSITLVKNSSSPGWLTLAAYFYPHLGANFLLDKKDAKDLDHKYDDEKYQEMAKKLFLLLKIEHQKEHVKLLCLVLKSAPNLVAALNLIKIPDFQELFFMEDELVKFFIDFFQKEIKKEKKETLWEKLLLFYEMPDKIRGNVQGMLYSTLLEYVKSKEGLTGDKEVFLKLILDLGKDQLKKILKKLSKSDSVSRQDLLLDILNYKPLENTWLQILHEDRFGICNSLVETRVKNIERTSKLCGRDKVVAVYQFIEALMQCFLSASIADSYAQGKFTCVVQSIANQDPCSVLKAFSCIEKLSSVVRKCYVSNVRKILTPMLIRPLCDMLKQYPGSSLGDELLLCVLEIIDVPEFVKGKEVNDDDFSKILAWWDIWIILLYTNATSAQTNSIGDEHQMDPSEKHLINSKMFENSKKYQDGKNICQQLKERIEEGNISLRLIKVLHQEKEKVSMLCAALLGKQVSKKAFENKICDLMHIKEDCAEKIQLLRSVISYARKLSNEVCPVKPVTEIETVAGIFNELNKTWHKKKINELQDDTFWRKLNPLLNPAKILQPLIDSLSFNIMAKNSLKRSSANGPSDIYSLVEFLSTETVHEFHTQWNSVLRYPGTITMGTMNILLGSLKNENTLDREVELIEKHFLGSFLVCNAESCSYGELLSRARCYLQYYVKCPNVKQVQHIIDILGLFKLEDRSNKVMSVLLKLQESLENSDKLTLAELHEVMEMVYKTIPFLSKLEQDGVITELSRSSELLHFMEEIVDEDVRFLIDAVEEHSDQFVSVSLVSDFIGVHGFLARLMKTKNKEQLNGQTFLELLQRSCVRQREIAAKIDHCNANVNSLRGLYTSIANRGQVIKEIISNCLNNGEYTVSQKDGKCETSISYVLKKDGENKKYIYSLSELKDLRSRAHLIVSSHKHAITSQCNHTEESSAEIDFNDFITEVNLLTEISTLLSKLRLSGYPNYKEFEQKITTISDPQHELQSMSNLQTTDDLQGKNERKSTKELRNTRTILQNDLNTWERELENARANFYFLNYYRSEQICTLYDFFMNGSKDNFDEVLSLINFVHKTTANELQLEENRKSHKELQKPNFNLTPYLFLSTVGAALKDIFSKSKHTIRLIPNKGQSQSNKKPEEAVTPGKIFVASLEPGSPLTANVILTLYENTTGAFPEPYEIVFCSSQTKWEELHLLLERCFTQSKYRPQNSLFCIVNVELLPNELQFGLVDAIEKRLESYQSSEVEKSADYQLALICRGGDHHHIVEQFAQYSHHISGMTDLAFANRLKSSWPDVKMITSTLPGLGKTETIKREAAEKSMNVSTFSISGPFEPSKLVKRLKQLNFQEYHCLHLDIGEVDDALSLDTFLFQLIITGMVSAGNHFYHLPTKHIYIEIANTISDWLQDSLVVLRQFTSIRLERQNYRDLLVSAEVTSNVQVVCQYLNVFDAESISSEEVHFSGPKRCVPQLAGRCRELLVKYYSSDTGITFTKLHTFLAVLANQLLTFSKSTFFKIESLKYMVGNEGTGVRKDLFEALLEVSKQFSSRAMRTCCSSEARNFSQNESVKALDKAMALTAKSAKNMVERAQEIAQWEDSNHLVVVFHALNSQAITAMYRKRSLVPENIEKLLTSQGLGENTKLEDLNDFTQEQLQEKLEKIACMKQSKKENPYVEYALTPDNILKMILIILRVRVNIPVIIMGETGCGKTSLARYLANTCGTEFYPFNFHAGRSEEEIITFIEQKESHAEKIEEKIWIFLDEINTCDHLGLISDIMCHHSLLGRPLSKYLVFLAACNPYKLRPEEHITTAGLEGRNITDESAKLVYRVHPLPEAMIDYVWDYGSLTSEDERAYIEKMVQSNLPENQDMLIDLLANSQRFIRDTEKNPFCVSLRDVHRCINLINWFEEMDKKRQNISTSSNKNKSSTHTPMVKSIVLALAHSYWFRLPTAESRKKYQKEITEIFCCKKYNKCKMDSFLRIVRGEEEDYLNRMELPHGTAKNAALRENVFVMLVCILNRIPVFVVGKPGCSKSLSIQLIRSSLRGRDSKDPLFKELPQLYVVSYQGSESSTSEGIIKVFEKARKYKDKNKDIIPVVLLDEVGLAENSKYNPLKVLHNLLEPGDGKLPDVAVVGISNWALDAAKMNRAIHLSIPEPTIEDLYEIGHSLVCTNSGDDNIEKDELRCLAKGYFEYQARQTHANFYGLRDYYSLIKGLKGCSEFKQIDISLQRNFGGLPDEVNKIQKIFREKLGMPMILSAQDIIPVTQLIQANLADPDARHLMLITSGDFANDILAQCLSQQQKEIVKIYGSRFEEDQSEEYNYRILSRIILCMERDCILILKDLESIYGSLYNMLNQNYVVVGKRKNCRVALGPYTNPMCQVNDGFRCIVLIEEDKVKKSDPPFLNRFEKQVLRFSDVFTKDQDNVVTELGKWVREMSNIEGLDTHFKETDMFIGFHKDTLRSLVYSHSHDKESSGEELLKKCKDDLMWTASPDSVLRTHGCNLSKHNPREMQELRDEYFKKPLHQGFSIFLKHVAANHQKSFFAGDEIGSKTVVMTFSNIHTDICQSLGSDFKCQVERLIAYKSERQLAVRINEFWNTPEKNLLVLQCKPSLDGAHLSLARTIIETERNSYKQCSSEVKEQGSKHICIVVHVQRGEARGSVPWQFSPMCGWRQVFLDGLEAHQVPLNEVRGRSVKEFLNTIEIQAVAKNQITWCFSCIKYTPSERCTNTILRIAKNLFNSEAVSRTIEKLVLDLIDRVVEGDWQLGVACNLESLVNSSTLYCAMKQFVSRLVRDQLAKIVYFLEKENAWPPHLAEDSNENLTPMLENLWCKRMMSSAISKISKIPEPRGLESYVPLNTSFGPCVLRSQVVIREINVFKELFLEDYKKLLGNEDNLDNNNQLKHIVQQQQFERFTEMIINQVPELNSFTSSDCCDLYMKDTFDMLTAEFSPMLSRAQRASVVQAIFLSEVKQNLPAKDMAEFFTLLHMFVWLHREKIFDLMRMIDCCQTFIELSVLTSVTNDWLWSSKIMLVESNGTDFSQEPRVTEHSNSGSEGSNETLDTETTSTANETESKENETEHYEELEHFGDILVEAYCEEMFPSERIVKKNNGIESWARNANIFLSLAFKVCQYPIALHFLRLCADFARIVFTPVTLQTGLSWLYKLSEIGNALKPNYLDHENSFKQITNNLIKPLKKDMEDQEHKQEGLEKFSALFYGRCIDTNVDTSNARPIVEHVLSLKSPALVMIMSPVILRLLVVEEKESRGIFMDIISNQRCIEECPCLQKIEEVLEDHRSKGFIHLDSYPVVMICDLIQRLFHFENHFKINDGADDELIELAKSTIEVVTRNSKHDPGLRVLSAVALLREFLTLVAKRSDIRLIKKVNSLLTNQPNYLKIFFKKQLHEHQSLFDVQKWIGLNVLPTAQNLWPMSKYQDKAVFTSVLKYPEYEEAKAAYLKKLESNDDLPMQEFCKECQKCPDHAFALLGFLINTIYVKQAARKLTVTEEELVGWFAKNVTLFSECKLFQELLLRVIGRADFYCQEMQLSTESSVEEVEMALLVLHIACVVATSALDEKLPMYRYATAPAKFERSCILAHCKDIRSVFEHQSRVKQSACVTCECGSRIAFKSDIKERKCAHCQEVLIDEKRSTAPKTITSLLSNSAKSHEWDLCTKHTSPAAYRALHLIVYSSFYVGIALQTTSEKQLSGVLNMLHGHDFGGDSSQLASFCFKEIETDLSHLMKILNCRKEVAMNMLHLVVEKSSDLIRSKNLLGENDCSTPTMCQEWEALFSQRTESVFYYARETSKEVKEMMTTQPSKDSQEIPFERQILELDSYPEEQEKQEKELKRLFRVTKQPRLENFRSVFLLSPKHVQEKHCLLMLFFAQFDQLQIIGHLHHLLKWTRLLSSELTHRISRKEAKSTSINEFINGDHFKFDRSQQEKETLVKLFENYKEAWNKMRDLVNQKLEHKEDPMPPLDEASLVAYCLTESDYGIYLQTAIKILVSYQNSILDAMISLSSKHRHPALSFLENDNGSSVMSVSIQEVGEQEIISFQWSQDDLFKFAQNNPEYGKGQEITYDFEQIEMRLGEKIAFGKCYLTEALNKFIFAGELFHSCGPLLTEIRSLLTQSEHLPKDVSDGLSKMQENTKNTQDLLPHIEVLIYLLRKKFKDFNVEMTLKDFAEKWSPMLPSPFPAELLPEPRCSLKITHVAALYEALEDVLADGAIEGLTPKYKEKLPEKLEKALASPKSEVKQLEPQKFLKVLRRFVFRYLSSQAARYWPQETTKLQSCLQEPSLWFPFQPPELDAIPHECTLQYIFSMVKYLERLNEEKRPKVSKLSKDVTKTRNMRQSKF